MSGKTCFMTFPKSAVDSAFMLIFPQKDLLEKKSFILDKFIYC